MGEAETRAVLASRVVVLEKLDGLNVGLDFDSSRRLRFWSRVLGEVRPGAMAPVLWPLLDWAYRHLVELWALLGTRRELFGEWLGLPGALPYPRRPADFVALGLREGRGFVEFRAARKALEEVGLVSPPLLFTGVPSDLERLTRRSAWGGPAEGAVLQHRGRWLKWVREDFAAPRLTVGKKVASREDAFFPTPGRTVRKWFSRERLADGERELEVLRRRVGPKVMRVERSARGLALELEHVGTGRWPRRTESAALVESLGRGLKKLHTLKGVAAPELPPSPSAHARPVNARVAQLLAAQERALEPGPTVLCHGDLKPSNVRVTGARAHLIDFERALYAERAWELACAADRLNLRAALLPALWKSAGLKRGDEVARAGLYRLAWTHLVATRPALGGPTSRRLKAEARARLRTT